MKQQFEIANPRKRVKQSRDWSARVPISAQDRHGLKPSRFRFCIVLQTFIELARSAVRHDAAIWGFVGTSAIACMGLPRRGFAAPRSCEFYCFFSIRYETTIRNCEPA